MGCQNTGAAALSTDRRGAFTYASAGWWCPNIHRSGFSPAIAPQRRPEARGGLKGRSLEAVRLQRAPPPSSRTKGLQRDKTSAAELSRRVSAAAAPVCTRVSRGASTYILRVLVCTQRRTAHAPCLCIGQGRRAAAPPGGEGGRCSAANAPSHRLAKPAALPPRARARSRIGAIQVRTLRRTHRGAERGLPCPRTKEWRSSACSPWHRPALC